MLTYNKLYQLYCMENLFSVIEAAKRLGVKPGTLRKWDKDKILIPIRVGTRGDRRYKQSDLDTFLMKTNQRIQWQEYIRSGISYSCVSQVIDALNHGIAKHFDRGIRYLSAYFEGTTLYWCYDKNDLTELGRHIVRQLNSQPNCQEQFFAEWDEATRQIESFLEEHNEFNNLFSLKNGTLPAANVYRIYNSILANWYSYTIIIDPLDESLMTDISTRIRSILESHGETSEKTFSDAFTTLTASSEQSYIAAEEEAIFKLAKDINEREVSKNSESFTVRINEILSRFWWTGLGWGRAERKTEQDVVIRLNEALLQDVNAHLRASLHANTVKKQNLKKLNAKYHFDADPELQSLLAFTNRLVAYHDRRKEIQVKTMFWLYQFIDAATAYFRLPPGLLEWTDGAEILSLLEGKSSDVTAWNLRSEHFFYLLINGKASRWGGRTATTMHKDLMNAKEEETKDVQGCCASGGKVIGAAFVALTVDAANKIAPGQILVTGMTTPDFLPAMKRAAAIVTDEGGITCHAAIVSRELGIPCIVGTKCATKRFHSGDIIEVAADHGVIRLVTSEC